MNDVLLVCISGLLILLGTLGAVLPFLPGLPLAFVGLALFAWFSKAVSIWAIAFFAVLILLTVLVDVLAPAIAASGKKASSGGILGAIIGGIIGIFVLGPIGIVLGPFVGAFIGEIANASSTDKALKVAWSSMLGLVIGSLFKLLVGTVMFIYFVVGSVQYLSS
ncbi:MAG: DUF456 domain-containing protein [Candidatus Doudnabacteria bacterium]|nr:DUF456 domain-containing protein [Candidatus Doudnabacteria bacterium]